MILQSTPEEMWAKFILLLNEKQPLRNGLPHKQFIGSIESYKQIFLEANK